MQYEYIQLRLLSVHVSSAFSKTSTPALPACAASPNDRRHRLPLGTPFINPAREHERLSYGISGTQSSLDGLGLKRQAYHAYAE